jgi:hypothetical protein
MPKLTLLSARGNVHNTGGINWGSNSKNHTRKFDAYIPLHLGTIRKNHPFFSPKKPTNTLVKFTWDDGYIMHGKFEGSAFNSHDNQWYPKQISSSPIKDSLGRYLRKRMGISSSRKILMSDFTSYGRTDVDIVQISPSEYLLDFHV